MAIKSEKIVGKQIINEVESQGSFFNKEIAKKYEYKKITK